MREIIIAAIFILLSVPAQSENFSGIKSAIEGAVTSRRLQDRGYSGWWQLSYITILGVFVIVLLCMLPSKEDENKWGRNPKLKN